MITSLRMHLEERIETTNQPFLTIIGFDTVKSTVYSTNEQLF